MASLEWWWRIIIISWHSYLWLWFLMFIVVRNINAAIFNIWKPLNFFCDFSVFEMTLCITMKAILNREGWHIDPGLDIVTSPYVVEFKVCKMAVEATRKKAVTTCLLNQGMTCEVHSYHYWGILLLSVDTPIRMGRKPELIGSGTYFLLAMAWSTGLFVHGQYTVHLRLKYPLSLHLVPTPDISHWHQMGPLAPCVFITEQGLAVLWVLHLALSFTFSLDQQL